MFRNGVKKVLLRLSFVRVRFLFFPAPPACLPSSILTPVETYLLFCLDFPRTRLPVL